MSLILHRSDGETFEYDGENFYHFGIKGMKWGVRRYQNEDGSLTPAGKRRYGYKNGKFKTRHGELLYKQDQYDEEARVLLERLKKNGGRFLDPKTYNEYLGALDRIGINGHKYGLEKQKYDRRFWKKAYDSGLIKNTDQWKLLVNNIMIPPDTVLTKDPEKVMAYYEDIIGKYPGKDREQILAQFGPENEKSKVKWR